MKQKKIAIVGNGRYGIFWTKFFTDRGCTVQSSDVGTNPSNEDIVRWAEVVIIAVTLSETVKVIQSIVPLLRCDQLLMDIASTKTNSVEAMLASKAEVIGLHPFCAPPRRGTFKGQTIFVCVPNELVLWREWVKEFLLDTKANIVKIQPEQHDRERCVDQVLEHTCTFLKASVMRRLGLSAANLFAVASPVYKLTAVQMARMFAQSPKLYGGIPMLNPFTKEIMGLFAEEFQRYVAMIERSDMKSYTGDFDANTIYIGATNIAESFALSEQLIGFMADLSEKNLLLITLTSDEPGILEKVGRFFREAGINLTVFHSRRLEGKLEFCIGFDRDTLLPEVVAVISRLRQELGAEVEEPKVTVI